VLSTFFCRSRVSSPGDRSFATVWRSLIQDHGQPFARWIHAGDAPLTPRAKPSNSSPDPRQHGFDIQFVTKPMDEFIPAEAPQSTKLLPHRLHHLMHTALTRRLHFRRAVRLHQGTKTSQQTINSILTFARARMWPAREEQVHQSSRESWKTTSSAHCGNRRERVRADQYQRIVTDVVSPSGQACRT